MKMMRLLIYVGVIVVLILLCIGLVTVYSVTCETSGTQMFFKQAMWIGFGIIGALGITFIKLEWMVKYSQWLLLLICIPLLYLAVAMAMDKSGFKSVSQSMPFLPKKTEKSQGSVKGSFRWLRFKSLTVQPSEFAKILLLLFLASYYGTRSRKDIRKFKTGFLGGSFCACGTILLIGMGLDLSTSFITAVMAGVMMFCAGVRIKHLLLLVVAAMMFGGAMIAVSPERLSRITSFRNTEAQKAGDGYQLHCSKMALGSGGLFGRGFAQSVMKKGYLPERHTDFILAIWGEEMGFIGIAVVIILFAVLMGTLLGIGSYCHDNVGLLICVGTCTLLTTQAIVNMGVVTGFLPTTGVTAPLLSYGGSSMLSLLLCLGLVGNVCRRNVMAILRDEQPGVNYPSFDEMCSNGAEKA